MHVIAKKEHPKYVEIKKLEDYNIDYFLKSSTMHTSFGQETYVSLYNKDY